MKNLDKNTITVFEHEAIHTTDNGKGKLTPNQLEALQKFSGDEGVPYFNLIHNGVKFCSYVGVLKVGQLNIEVLPKIDKKSDENKDHWKNLLIDMLKKVGMLDVSVSSETNLKIKKNSILDLYIEAFLVQVDKLIRQGLIKKYRKNEANCTALKGKIVFSKHILKNITHKERFYVKYTVYDRQHVLNQILYKTLQVIQNIATTSILQSQIGTMLLSFPEMPYIRASENLFSNVVYNRKNESYRQALLISRMLLLNYHPDINLGSNHIVALMFDMNLLWEKFVYVSLRRHFKEGKVESQRKKTYYMLNDKRVVNLKPDVVIIKNGCRYVLDTKWKLPNNNKPGYSDLQQMYAYTKYFQSDHTILCFPGNRDEFITGSFFNEVEGGIIYPCSILRIALDSSLPVYKWQKNISEIIQHSLERF